MTGLPTKPGDSLPEFVRTEAWYEARLARNTAAGQVVLELEALSRLAGFEIVGDDQDRVDELVRRIRGQIAEFRAAHRAMMGEVAAQRTEVPEIPCRCERDIGVCGCSIALGDQGSGVAP